MSTDPIPNVNLKTVHDVTKELFGEQSEFKGEPFEVSLKLRGSPIAISRIAGDTVIHTPEPNAKLVELATECGLMDKMSHYKLDIVLLGTAVGPDFRDNTEGFHRNEIFITDVYIPDEDTFLRPEERYRVCLSLGLLHVPVFGFLNFNYKEAQQLETMAGGQSVNKPERDGIVFTHSLGQFKFQVVNPKLKD